MQLASKLEKNGPPLFPLISLPTPPLPPTPPRWPPRACSGFCLLTNKLAGALDRPAMFSFDTLADLLKRCQRDPMQVRPEPLPALAGACTILQGSLQRDADHTNPKGLHAALYMANVQGAVP